MFPWMPSLLLAAEANRVVALRMMKLARGGARANDEAVRMMAEKYFAALRAGMTVAAGGTAADVVAGYRRKVRANKRRLARRKRG